MEEMSGRVERGSATIEDAIEMFDEIAVAVQEAESGITEISDATDDQAASSEEVVAMVDEVSSVSQQTATEASSVSAATEEQSASLSETAENIQHLSQLADDLHAQVADFEIQDGAQKPGPVGSGNTRSSTVADGGRSSKTRQSGSESR
jgi:methyl-accepting chemotaxis protein